MASYIEDTPFVTKSRPTLNIDIAENSFSVYGGSIWKIDSPYINTSVNNLKELISKCIVKINDMYDKNDIDSLDYQELLDNLTELDRQIYY